MIQHVNIRAGLSGLCTLKYFGICFNWKPLLYLLASVTGTLKWEKCNKLETHTSGIY